MTVSRPAIWFLGLLLFICGASAVYSQVSPLRVKITVPTMTFRNSERVYVATAILNTGTTEQMLVVMSCPEWTSDSTVIRVDAPSCLKNVPRKVPLKPGEEFRSVVHIYAERADDQSNSDKVTFRLGYHMPAFFRSSEVDPKIQPLWSNAVSVIVTR
jgi:hypothetical protein